MIRPESHEIDSAADALFCCTFAKWAVNPTKRDYGRDYIVEYFKDHKSTGVMFAGQLKGSHSTRYSADGTFISQTLEQDAADYLARQLELPTFLFHADVITGKLYWSAIQKDRRVLASLECGETQSLTVRIPTANELPEKMDTFNADLMDARTALLRRMLKGERSIDFLSIMARQPVAEITAAAEDLHVTAFRLALHAAHQHFKTGDVDGAIAAIQKVLTESISYTEIQFNGTLQRGEWEVLTLMRSPGLPQSHVADKKLQTALKLCQIAKREPRYLHLAAQMYRRAAELSVAVHNAFGLLMTWNIHRKRGGESLWATVLAFQMQEGLLVAHRKYTQAMRLAKATANSRYRAITSRPLVEIALAIGTLARVLESCDLRENALPYQESAFEIMKFAAAIAHEHGSIDDVYNAVAYARILERDTDGEIFKWIRSVVDGWPEESEERRNAEYLLQRSKERLAGAQFDGDIETTPIQVHHNVLTAQGIDPTKEPWVSLILLAIRDDDPTRVLIDCEHKVVAAHPGGDPFLVKVGLERANPKLLACSQYGYKLGGQSLDAIDEEFKRRHCSTCLVRTPRAADWTLTRTS